MASVHALPEEIVGFIASHRVGRLGTADAEGKPLVVPFCYAFDGAAIFSAVDAKPKRQPPEGLRRVRNIRENPKVCVLIDHWDEDWRHLRHVIIHGAAELVTSGPEYRRGAALLLAKYEQYRRLGLDCERGMMIKITPGRVVQWSGQS